MRRHPSSLALKTLPSVVGRSVSHVKLVDALLLMTTYAGITSVGVTGNKVQLRSGDVIPIRDREDLATVVVVMLRQDYGRVAPGAIVVDIGANIGVFSLWACLCGASKVIAVEPEPRNIDDLKQTCTRFIKDGLVTVEESAVGASISMRKLALRGSQTHSLNGSIDGPSVEVACLSIESLFDRHGLDRIDLLKMDIEGGEYEAFYATSIAALRRVRHIRMEFHNQGGESEKVDPLVAFLRRSGFVVTKRIDISRNSGMLWLDMGANKS